MTTNIIQIGNSRGVILSAEILRKLHLTTKSAVKISVDEQQIVVKPAPRQGWANAFKQFAASGSEEMLIPDVFEDEDLSDITW